VARPSLDTLRRVPLFSELEDRDLKRIADSFKQRDYGAGDTIASEGSGGAGFFVIGEGTAKVDVHGKQRATLGPGDYFGEIALIDEGARMATITAASDLVCYGLTLWEFRPLVQENGAIGWKLMQTLARELRAAEKALAARVP
jgi:CRP/FNR family transcriptional regulator, cyclic AMP receptor protein